jgi:hypothetical protein
MKNLTITLFASLLIFSIISCSNDKPSIKQTTTVSDTEVDSNEVRLGSSNYYLKLPDSFKLTEARGKEGQLGYNIIPNDTASQMSAFIEIEKGRSIPGSLNWGQEKEKIQSTLLNKPISWTVYNTDTGYFVAITADGEVTARVTSNKRNEIDSLITIVSTLRRK